MTDEQIPIAEAARRSGLHSNTVQRLVREGKLTGHKDGRGRWLVDARALSQYASPWNGAQLDRPGPKQFLRQQGPQ